MNLAATKMLGWTEEELLGKVMSDLILPRGAERSLIREEESELLKVRSEGRQVRLDDIEYACKNGSQLSVAVSRCV